MFIGNSVRLMRRAIELSEVLRDVWTGGYKTLERALKALAAANDWTDQHKRKDKIGTDLDNDQEVSAGIVAAEKDMAKFVIKVLAGDQMEMCRVESAFPTVPDVVHVPQDKDKVQRFIIDERKKARELAVPQPIVTEPDEVPAAGGDDDGNGDGNGGGGSARKGGGGGGADDEAAEADAAQADAAQAVAGPAVRVVPTEYEPGEYLEKVVSAMPARLIQALNPLQGDATGDLQGRLWLCTRMLFGTDQMPHFAVMEELMGDSGIVDHRILIHKWLAHHPLPQSPFLPVFYGVDHRQVELSGVVTLQPALTHEFIFGQSLDVLLDSTHPFNLVVQPLQPIFVHPESYLQKQLRGDLHTRRPDHMTLEDALVCMIRARLPLMTQVTRAVAETHRRSIVHGNLQAQHVMVAHPRVLTQLEEAHLLPLYKEKSEASEEEESDELTLSGEDIQYLHAKAGPNVDVRGVNIQLPCDGRTFESFNQAEKALQAKVGRVVITGYRHAVLSDSVENAPLPPMGPPMGTANSVFWMQGAPAVVVGEGAAAAPANDGPPSRLKAFQHLVRREEAAKLLADTYADLKIAMPAPMDISEGEAAASQDIDERVLQRLLIPSDNFYTSTQFDAMGLFDLLRSVVSASPESVHQATDPQEGGLKHVQDWQDHVRHTHTDTHTSLC